MPFFIDKVLCVHVSNVCCTDGEVHRIGDVTWPLPRLFFTVSEENICFWSAFTFVVVGIKMKSWSFKGQQNV